MRNANSAYAIWPHLLLVLACLFPLLILFLVPSSELLLGGIVFWLLLLASLSMLWMFLSGRAARVAVPEMRMILPEEQPEVIREIMDVRLATERDGVRIFRGRLVEAADTAYAKLRRTFTGQTVPLLQEDEQLGAAVALLPKPVEEAQLERPIRPWLSLLLFGLTIVTTTWAGAAHQGVNLLQEPKRFTVGLPYALGLLAILGVHELGHYFAALRHGIRVTPPYFIPVPFGLGTFGAFIQMRSPTHDRRALFDVAVAGPLAGLAVAVPALLIGLEYSSVVTGTAVGGDETNLPTFIGGTSAGSSLLLAFLAKLALPEALRYGYVLQLSPLAFAGWLGLLVTALNLLPIGQLDGGHLARSLFGTRVGSRISSLAMWSLLLLALFVWPGLLTWAILVFLLAGNAPIPPLNDLTDISPGRRWLGYATFAVLALILVPLPRALWSATGIHCPYL